MIVIYIILALFAAILLSGVLETRSPELNRITLRLDRLPSGFDGLRIAQISDFHNAKFGKDNEKLLKLLCEAKPDIIAITGDFVDFRRTKAEISLKFAENLVKIAPVYYVSGNHEARIADYKGFAEQLVSRGVTVLDNRLCDIERCTDKITLLGVSDPAFYEKSGKIEENIVEANLLELLNSQNLCGNDTSLSCENEQKVSGDEEKENGDRLKSGGLELRARESGQKAGKSKAKEDAQERIIGESKQETMKNDERFKLLLLHRPQYIDCCERNGIDLVLSGHAHGGQVRIPFVGGILAPEQGLFPKYDAGLYKKGKTNVIVSRGLGNSSFPIRINNRPEIVLVELRERAETSRQV